MRRTPFSSRLVGAALGLSCALSVGTAGGGPAFAATSGPGTISTLHLAFPGSGTPRDVEVWRPPVPDSAQLPVLYLLHGVPGGADGLLEGTGLQARLDQWVEGGGAPFVVAVPDGNGDHHEDTEWADAADGSDQVETFVTRTVTAAVEGRLPRSSARRSIAGFSMGGFGAMNLALRHRDLYGSVVSMSGYYQIDDPSGMFGRDPANRAANTPALQVGHARGLPIWLGVGASDPEPVVRGQAQAFGGELAAAHIPYVLRTTPGGHSWAVVVAQWPDIERFLTADWSGAGAWWRTPHHRARPA